MNRGKLIVLESTDGGGKGTQSELIGKYLTDNNLKYKYIHFPAYEHNQFSDIISRFLRGEFGQIKDVDPLFVANMYAMDRFRFLPELELALSNYDVVLLDRYVFSNIAYQCAKFDDEIEIEKMSNWITDFEFGFLNLPYPDLNIFLNVPTKITKERLESKREGSDREYLNGKEDIHERDIDFQEKVRNMYIKAMEGTANCKIIDCALMENVEGKNKLKILTPEEVFNLYEKYLEFILFDREVWV